MCAERLSLLCEGCLGGSRCNGRPGVMCNNRIQMKDSRDLDLAGDTSRLNPLDLLMASLHRVREQEESKVPLRFLT
jgi:hypothetical protein